MITPIATLSQEIETDTVATESNKVDYQALIEEFGYRDGLG